MGILYKRQGDGAKALDQYKSALKCDKKNFFPNYNMGVLLSLDKGRHQESIMHLKIAAEQANKEKMKLYELNALINLALIEEVGKAYEDALTHMERALQLDPENEKISEKIEAL